MNENADNLSQNETENMEEALGNALNTDDSQTGTQHLNDALEGEDGDSPLQTELNELRDKHLRLVAEFDNFKKRNARERMELIQTAGKDIIQNLLVVLDDSDRAAKQMETTDDVETMKQGIGLVFSKLHNTLQQKGLRKMESIGQPFNADLHEAITEIPAPTPEQVGTVIDEVEPGYYLNEKLIRHAKVVVGK